MNRRHFLYSCGAATAGLALPRVSRATAASEAGEWRTFEVTTGVEVLKPAGHTRVWLPLPLTSATSYQEALGNTFRADGGKAREERAAGAAMLIADWPEDIAHAAMVMVIAPGRRVALDRISFEMMDPLGFDAAALSKVPHNAYHDAVALRDYVLARERR